jgi:MinD superfamily P-loop ATPase
MKEILVLSGKGGSGKTSLTSSFIEFSNKSIGCDYDVDASNLPLLFSLDMVEEHPFSGGQTASIDPSLCIACGLCENLCRFEAISNLQVQTLTCEGCALCTHICPVQAITMRPRSSGRWFSAILSDKRNMFFAELRPGEENSGKLVACIKDQARQVAQRKDDSIIISDGPAGLGCSVISALTAVDLVIIISEPSISGIADVQRLYQLIKTRGIKAVLVINKFDINLQGSCELEKWAASEGIPLCGRIPFDNGIFTAISSGVVPGSIAEVRPQLMAVWEEVLLHIK